MRAQALLVAALTVGLFWLTLRNIDLGELWRALTQAHPGWIAAAVAVTMLTFFIRAWRWQALLVPIGHAGFSTVFRATIIGFTASFLLPARIGEVLKPYLVARREGFNVAATFATVIVERLLDLLTVLLLFGLAIPLTGVDVGSGVRTAGVVAAAGGLVVTILLFVLAGHPERLGAITARLTARLPVRLARALSNFARTFAEGLGVMRSPWQLVIGFLWSLPLWFSIGLGIWFTSRAFGLTFPFIGSFLVTGYLSVGVAAPTPGAAGGFHLAYQMAVTNCFGAPASVAAAAAFVLHAVSFVPVTLLGLVYMWQDGLTLGSLKQMKAEAQSSQERPSP
jgi:uncharacterized protein (TIRG00374 family)